MSEKPTMEFMYLLNAFERGSQSDKPADNGYSAKRIAVLDYVSRLERERDALREALRELIQSGDEFSENDNPAMMIRYGEAIERARALLGKGESAAQPKEK